MMNDDYLIDVFEPVLSIGIVAKKINVSVQTIRLYEKEGLILPHRTASGRRLYSLHDLKRLRSIRNMIADNGLNLKGIKALMSLVPCWDYKGGVDEDCKGCPAFSEAVKPCWSIGDVGAKCQNQDCRNCPVYLLEITHNNLKEIILKR